MFTCLKTLYDFVATAGLVEEGFGYKLKKYNSGPADGSRDSVLKQKREGMEIWRVEEKKKTTGRQEKVRLEPEYVEMCH